MVDRNEGVWQAPANVSLSAVFDVTLKITDRLQAGLNVAAAAGKSINAIVSGRLRPVICELRSPDCDYS